MELRDIFYQSRKASRIKYVQYGQQSYRIGKVIIYVQRARINKKTLKIIKQIIISFHIPLIQHINLKARC